MKLDEMTQFAKKNNNIDLATQIKSDNHLRISFHSLSKGLDITKRGDKGDKSEGPEEDSNIRQGTLMQVEVLLYRFKHPTAEALLTSTPQSLSYECTSLGKCVVPYSANGDVSDTHQTSSLSIPGSVLSWKGTNGVLGTHMLAFRVTPCVAEMEVENSIPERKRISRKRKANFDVGTKHVNNLLIPPNLQNGPLTDKSMVNGDITHSSTAPNGLINKVEPIKAVSKTDFLAESNELCNGHWEGNDIQLSSISSISRLQRKAPGGKKLPTIGEQMNELVVSYSRSLLAQDVGQKTKTKKRNEVQLLIDGDKSKTGWIPPDKVTTLTSDEMSLTSRSIRSTDDAVIGPIPRKRIQNDLSTDISQNGYSPDTTSTDTTCYPPPHKKPCIAFDAEPSMNHVKSASSSCSSSPSSNAPEHQDMSVYCAELVAFDSRQECLLLDGKYEILMQKCSQDSKKDAETCKRYSESLSSLEWDSMFSKHTVSENDGVDDIQSLTLNFTAKWFTDPPKSRPRDVINTAFDFVQLRKEYESIISKDLSKTKTDPLSRETSSNDTSSSLSSVESSLSSLKPIVFNFLYNKNTLQQTELKDNLVCPWCSLDCKYLYSLLKHMSLCHPRFQFTYSPADRGIATVDVRINKTYYTKEPSADPVERMGTNSINIKRRPTKCKSSTSLVVDKCDECSSDLSEFIAGKRLARPKLSRIFYHTQSCLPMMPNERDSEEENVTEWLKTTSMKMVDEFIDVNCGEKQFMKVWNLYMMENKIMADKQMPQACLTFAKEKKQELKEKSILYNLVTHIIYMCDIGLVPPCTLTEVIRVIQNDSP